MRVLCGWLAEIYERDVVLTLDSDFSVYRRHGRVSARAHPSGGRVDESITITRGRLCLTTLWPAGTFAPAYAANQKAAVEGTIEADRCQSASANLRRNPAGGRERPPIFFVLPPIYISRVTKAVAGWPKIRAPSLAASVARRRS